MLPNPALQRHDGEKGLLPPRTQGSADFLEADGHEEVSECIAVKAVMFALVCASMSIRKEAERQVPVPTYLVGIGMTKLINEIFLTKWQRNWALKRCSISK